MLARKKGRISAPSELSTFCVDDDALEPFWPDALRVSFAPSPLDDTYDQLDRMNSQVRDHDLAG
jgi:hypothetical protein